MQCCEKKFLYETDAQGLLYITLDDQGPIYVGFQKRIKIELCLVQECETEGAVLDLNLCKRDDWEQSNNTALLANSRTGVSDEECVIDKCVPPSQPVDRTCTDQLTKDVPSEYSDKDTKLPFPDIKDSNFINCFDETAEDTNVETKRIRMEEVRQVEQNTLCNAQKTKSALRKAKQKLEENQQIVQKRIGNAQDRQKNKLLHKMIFKKNSSRKKKQTSDEKTAVLTKEQLSHLLKLTAIREGKTGDGKLAQGKVNSPNIDGETLPPELEQDASANVDHGENYEKVVSIKCDYCNVSFPNKKEFQNHIKLESEVYHLCVKCQTAFPLKAYLLVHMKYHNRNDKGAKKINFSCDSCTFRGNSLSALKRHMICHTGEHCFKCCCCVKTFASHSKLVEHMRVHRAPGLFRCNCCNQLFPSRGALTEHKKSVLKILCGLCGKEFPNTASRLVHYKSDHQNAVLTCKVCDRIYPTQAELAEHMERHKKRKRKQCRICGMSVIRLDRHELTHKPLEEMTDAEVFMCDQCPSRFKAKNTLKVHMQIHAKERSKCHLCSQSFSTQTGLHRHFGNVHSNLMPFQCEVCGKRCKQKSNLRVHMRIHSDTKMFPCSLCSQAFNYKCSLENHMKSKHSDTNLDNSRTVEIPLPRDSSIPADSDIAWNTSLSTTSWENGGQFAWNENEDGF
ncbi:Zinc finger protein 235 [Plakobranchus ocellatus]|uniref:Zinc finger protein 235 n=1 Tax=Plakobranchus ocellatus TaxID=259542 RepID=A0AAV4AZT3_9GAST|nr:Zinc finger protein 235 [Plakobranchus ocellatus]